MTPKPWIPLPSGELRPQELCDRIRQWAESHGFEYELLPHASEFGIVIVRDPANGSTGTTIPNSHRGRRLRQDQIRYVVQKLNLRWKD